MVIIEKGWHEPFEIVGEPIWNTDIKYKESIYNYKLRVDGGNLYYNSFSKAIVFIGLFETFEPNEALVNLGLFVDSTIDEYKRTVDFKALYRDRFRGDYSDLGNFILFMTIGCNAHCPYCFEKDFNHKLFMNKKTALDIAKYIVDHATKDFKVTWFGGEPFTNPDAINIISDYLNKNSKYKWHAIAISNGYLLKDIDVDTLKSEWRIQNIQITIDGIFEDYENVKQLSTNHDSFTTVMDNIQKCADNGISVDVRLNAGMDNFDQLAKVVKYVNNYFWWYDNIVMYARPIYRPKDDDWTEDELKVVYDNYDKLCQMIELTAIGQKHPVEDYGWKGWKFYNCMSDKHDSICITPVGNLTNCEHDVETNIIGNIYSDKLNKDVYQKFEEMRDELPWCADCKRKPMCALTKSCPGMPKCTPQLKEMYNNHILDNMAKWWRDWLLGQRDGQHKIEEVEEDGDKL